MDRIDPARARWKIGLLLFVLNPAGCGWLYDQEPYACESGRGAGGHGGNEAQAGNGGAGPATPIAMTLAGVTPWKHGATGAYSLIHDDLCGSWVSGLAEYALPGLRERGLRAGFSVIVNQCADDRQLLEQTLADGHELINHSMSHPHIMAADAAYEVLESKRELDALVAGQMTTFFAFPFDEVNTGVLDVVRSAGYLGARGGYGRNGINAPDFSDPFVLEFDAFGPDTAYPDHTANPLGVLDGHVLAAMEQGGWAVREVHGVADQSWEPVPADVYLSHLDHLAGWVASGSLWVAPPSEVLRYRFSRQYCGAPRLVGNHLHFITLDERCGTYATELSLEITSDQPLAELTATQGNAGLAVEQLDQGRYLVSINPTSGPATLTPRPLE